MLSVMSHEPATHERPVLRPVSARSALLSVMLGAHPPSVPVRDLVDAMAVIGISESTTRVALTRMVAAGDVSRSDTVYTLSERLRERQRHLDAVHKPQTRAWRGTWEIAVITAGRRSAPDRASLRSQLTAMRVAELREGVWTRPANLRRGWTDELKEISTCFEARPLEDPRELAARLWDLDGWAATTNALLEALAATHDPATRFTIVATGVRHLLGDPMLPPELEPPGWPGQALREAYEGYRTWLLSG